MKKLFSLLLCAITLFACCAFHTSAVDDESFVPYIIDFSLTSSASEKEKEVAESRASGLILIYGLEISVVDSKLKIRGETYCEGSVVKSGFKNLVVQRKKTTSSTWSDYYDFGDLYNESYSASINITLAVASGYQYRVTCKHYAKKNLLVTQSISNTSNVVII